MIVRRLTEQGLAAFTDFLASLTTTSPQPLPTALLDAAQATEVVLPAVEAEPQQFQSRFEVARYCLELFKNADWGPLERDRGVWAWLALFYFDQLCRRGPGGKYKPGALARWIPELAYNRYYRHLVAGPVRIMRAHRDNPDRAMGLLAGSPDRMGDVVEQIAAYQELVTNKAVVGAVTALYTDVAGKYKRGAGGKEAGSPRRFVAVLKQFELTHDLRSMNMAGLLGILPREFERFKKTIEFSEPATL